MLFLIVVFTLLPAAKRITDFRRLASLDLFSWKRFVEYLRLILTARKKLAGRKNSSNQK